MGSELLSPSLTVRKIGFLSAAPRVSTHPDAEADGPRSHILGVIHAFEALGWEVERFVVGDRVPPSLVQNSERALIAHQSQRLVADVARILFGALNARRAWRELGPGIDWVYERFATLQSLGWIFQQHGIPWVLETNGPFFYEAKDDRNSLVLTKLARRRECEAYHRCDALIAVSSALKHVLVQELEINPAKIVVVPNGVDLRVFNPCHHAPRRFFAEFTVGFVGSLIHWQGIDLLIRATAMLCEEGVPLCIVVVGDGPYRQQWEELAQSIGLGDRVRFIGHVPWSEVPTYIAGFDIGFSGQIPTQLGIMYHSPLKLYEYMAMQKPVLASAFDDARVLVDGKGTGFLFQPGNVMDLAHALRQAYKARQGLPLMGRIAREEVVARHSWEDRVGFMISEVNRILASNKYAKA